MSTTRIGRLLVDRARRSPDRAAFLRLDDGSALSWAMLAERAARWRSPGSPEGGAGSRVGLLIAEPLDFVTTFLAVLAAGDCAVPLDHRTPAGEVDALAEQFRLDALVTGLDDGAPAAFRTAARTSGQRRPAARVPLPATALLTSSGTTGVPKGIPLDEQRLLGAATRIVEHHRLRPEDRGLCPLPLFHVNAQVVGVLATLVSGGSLGVGRFARGELWGQAERLGATWVNAVPAIIATLADEPAPPPPVRDRLRFVRTASAPLPVPVLDTFARSTGVSILETYGMTEVASQICANPLSPEQRRPGSVGLPVGVELIIAAEGGRPAGDGEAGEVWLRGPAVVDGYLGSGPDGAERLLPARNEQGWLPTGDVGHRDADGFVYLSGRLDDLINRGGEKVYPSEVESVLLHHPDLLSAAVVGRPDSRLGQVPVAVVVPAEGVCAERLVAELPGWCAARLSPAKRPVSFEVAGELPVGRTGKLLRRAVRERMAVR
jgi:acyl-CoA synthetase (AMP-forming)/AMP-acid ligase II